MDMMLVDEQGDQIQAVVRKDLMKDFKEVMTEGLIYKLSHFIIGINKRGYKQCLNNYVLWFTPLTSVIPIEDSTVNIPHHKFNLFPFNRLAERVSNNAMLTDVIAQITGIENKIQGTTESSNRRTIHIRDEKGEAIKATLWGDRANLIPDQLPNPMQPKIAIITATRVTVYNGTYQLNSTNATNVCIDLDIPEVHEFKREITKIGPKEVSQIQVAQPETLVQSMAKNKKTIRQLQELQMTSDCAKALNASYTCVGRIVMVLEEECGWRYTSCNVCKSKIDETQYCNKCQFNPPFPVERYRLVITLHDGDAALNVGLFDKDVEKVVGKPMSAMDKISRQVNGPERVSKELQQCIGKECTLKVKLNATGYIQDLTATKVLDVQNKTPTIRPKVYQASNKELEADTALAIENSLQDEIAKNKRKRNVDQTENEGSNKAEVFEHLVQDNIGKTKEQNDLQNRLNYQEQDPHKSTEAQQKQPITTPRTRPEKRNNVFSATQVPKMTPSSNSPPTTLYYYTG